MTAWVYTDESQRFVTRTLPSGEIQSTFVSLVPQGDEILPYEADHAKLWERAIAEMRALRQPILDVLDGLQASSNTLGLLERARVIETAKQGLRDITKIDLNDCSTYAQMRAKVGLAYAALVSSLPSDIKAAFKEATQ